MEHTSNTRARRRIARHDRRPQTTGDHGHQPYSSTPRYDRRLELPRALPLWPHELDDETPEGRRRIVGKLYRALRAERRRGIAGHWTYDLARHAELLRVYRLEVASCGMPDIRRSGNNRDDASRLRCAQQRLPPSWPPRRP